MTSPCKRGGVPSPFGHNEPSGNCGPLPGSPVSLVAPDISDEDARWLAIARAVEANRVYVDAFLEQTGKLPWDFEVRTAYHEAGHCLWYFHNRTQFHEVSIVPDRWSDGRVWWTPERPPQGKWVVEEMQRLPQSETDALRNAERSLSGIAAECELLSMARPHDHAEINKARTLLDHIWRPALADCVLEVMWRRLCKRWAAPINWASIDALARTLLRRKTLSYASACVIIDAARRSKMLELGHPVTTSAAIPA